MTVNPDVDASLTKTRKAQKVNK